LSPAEAGDQPLPGATVESVVAVARRLNPTVAAASLDFDAAVHKIGTAGVLADPALVLEAWDVNRLGVGQRRFGVEQEVKLWGKYGLERDIAQADADAAKFQGRATVTELVAQVIAAHGNTTPPTRLSGSRSKSNADMMKYSGYCDRDMARRRSISRTSSGLKSKRLPPRATSFAGRANRNPPQRGSML
jgi:hypothetical protein